MDGPSKSIIKCERGLIASVEGDFLALHLGQGKAVPVLVHLDLEALIHAPIDGFGFALAAADFGEKELAIGEKFTEELLGIAAGFKADEDAEEIGMAVFLLHELGGMGVEKNPSTYLGHAGTLNQGSREASLLITLN
jgi:hypothetical protein